MIKVSKADVLRLMGLWAGTMNSYMKFMGYLDSVAVFIDLFQIQWDKQACHGITWLSDPARRRLGNQVNVRVELIG